MSMKDNGASDQALGTLVSQLGLRDEKIRALGQELERRTTRLEHLERRLRADAIVSDDGNTLTFVQVFWPVAGILSEKDSTRAHIRQDSTTHELTIELPVAIEGELRIDPGETISFWEFQQMSLHALDAERALSPEPVVRVDATNGFAGLQVARGAVKLSGREAFRLYALDADPQLTWKVDGHLPGPLALKIRCRALGAVHGYREAEHGLLREVIESYGKLTADAFARQQVELEAAVAAREQARAEVASRLSQMLELAQKKSESTDAELASLHPQVERLRTDLDARDEAHRQVLAKLAAAQAQLDQTVKLQFEVTDLRLNAQQGAREVAEQQRELERVRAAAAEAEAQAQRAREEAARARAVVKELQDRDAAPPSPAAERAELERLRQEVANLRNESAKLLARATEANRPSLRQRVAGSPAGRLIKRLSTEKEQVTRPDDGFLPRGGLDPVVVELFDEAYYRAANPDLISGDPQQQATPDLLEHYINVGWKEGRDPCAVFSTRFYISKNPDVAEHGVCPLVHFVAHGAAEGRSPHPLFDIRYYLHWNKGAAESGQNPLLHFIRQPDKRQQRPHALFDANYYLHHAPDSRSSPLNVLHHYLVSGSAAGKSPHALFDRAHYLRENPDVARSGMDPLIHFVTLGGGERRNPHPLFDVQYYLAQNPEIAHSGLTALEHYVVFGWREGRNPHPLFDVPYYLRSNPDVARTGMEPLEHFILFGFRERRDPSPAFDTAFYAASNPAAAQPGVNPLLHYLSTQKPSSLLSLPRLEAAPLRLVVLLPEWSEQKAIEFETASSLLKLQKSERYSPEPGDYVYSPASEATCLPASQLSGVLLCLGFQKYDFLIVTHDLVHPADGGAAKAVRVAGKWGGLILSADAWGRAKWNRPLEPGSLGRIVRVLPAPVPVEELVALSLEDLGLGEFQIRDNGEVAVLGPNAAARAQVLRREPPARMFFGPHSSKPLVLTMPSMLAVGGVERNMIEMMHALGGKYDFAIVTDERIRGEAGSLHHQAAPLSHVLIDLNEIAPQDLYLPMLRVIRDCLAPEVVWLCNGSIWLTANSEGFREVFAGVAIVDQEVYDASAGWIAHFADNRGLRSFDRYAAVNSHVARAFIETHGIPAENVDLIYPMIDEARFQLVEWDAAQVAEARGRWGLPGGDVPIFAQVGRLTAQKRPLDFLDVVRRAKAAGMDAHFVLVGSGELASDCDAYIAEHELGDVVTRIPFIEDPSKFYPLLSGLIVCSAFEGLPIVVLENLAMGNPILSTDVGDVRKVVEEYGSGRIVEGWGGEAIVAALGAFIGELPAVREAARKSAGVVNQRFSARSIGEKYDRCFENARLSRGYDLRVGSSQGISVVMPTYNRIDELRGTLQMCLRYSAGLPVEFVVIDDGSRDGTGAYLASLAKVVPSLVYRAVPNGGPGQARNLGASLARHEIVQFIGDDVEPADKGFFTTHLDLHLRDRSRSLAVLGKMVWPDTRQDDVSFVMQHIQGVGGEQFGYADLRPYSKLDWRFFYTANISVKKGVVPDWTRDGFRKEFRFAAWEDAELAYRIFKSPASLSILYAPSSVGYHKHAYSVDQFLNRQVTSGMMARVMMDLHPEISEQIISPEILGALDTPLRLGDQNALGDYTALIEGLKAYARLIESQHKIGSVHWHQSLLYGVFELAYLQGFLTATSKPDANFGLAYRRVIEQFYRRTQHALQTEFLGYIPRVDKLVPGIV